MTKLYLQLLGEVYVCELYYWPARVFSKASWRWSSFNLSLDSLTWLTYAYGMRCQDDVTPGEFLLIQCACQFLGLGTSTYVCSWSITDCYIIKWCGSHAWYGWTIKAMVEAKVLYDGFTVSCRGIIAPLIIARPLDVSILLMNIRLA
jgi:hypothetical protein